MNNNLYVPNSAGVNSRTSVTGSTNETTYPTIRPIVSRRTGFVVDSPAT